MGNLFALDVLGEPKPWQVFIRRGAPSVGYLAYKAYQLNIQARVKEHWRGRPPLEETPLEIRLRFFRGYLRSQSYTNNGLSKPYVVNLTWITWLRGP